MLQRWGVSPPDTHINHLYACKRRRMWWAVLLAGVRNVRWLCSFIVNIEAALPKVKEGGNLLFWRAKDEKVDAVPVRENQEKSALFMLVDNFDNNG